MNWREVFASSAITILGLSAIAFLAKGWVTARLTASIAAEYSRQLEKFKHELQWEARRREQAAKVAEVFSLWMAMNYNSSRKVNELRYELQQKYWELSVWLDATVLRQVNAVLASKEPPGLAHKAAFIAIRKSIVGPNDDIAPDELAHWDPVTPTSPDPEREDAAT